MRRAFPRFVLLLATVLMLMAALAEPAPAQQPLMPTAARCINAAGSH